MKEVRRLRSKEEVVSQAKKLGFFAIGFAKAEPLKIQKKKYQQWVQKGYHGDMKWLTSDDLRTNPKKFFPRVRTVIVVALSYYQSGGPKDFAIARYALGQDYHTIVKRKLDVLAKYIHKNDRGAYRAVCDTSPVAEKAWAVKSGIGWRGKNSLVVTEEAGSFFVLGICFSSQVFPPSKMQKNRCDDCDACIKACPQKALAEPHVLDARKCNAYWTVEKNASDAPPNIRKNMGRWAFGCDICQLVCPFNRKALSNMETFGNRFQGMTLEDIRCLDDEAFCQTFSGNALYRRKKAGFDKNIRAIDEDSKKREV